MISIKKPASDERNHPGQAFALLQSTVFIFAKQFLNAVIGIQKIADGSIVVQGIYDICNIFAHVAVDIIGLFQKLWCRKITTLCQHNLRRITR